MIGSEHRVHADGVQLYARLVGTGPLVVLVHGFPESWYSWRHQMRALADAGFTVCAIDVRGYGGSDRPDAVAAYDLETLIGDVCAVVDAFGHGDPAVLVGHDWGAPIVWNTALCRPDKVRAVAGLSVPYLGPPTVPALDLYTAFFTARGKFFYQVYFQDEGVAEAELEADVRGALRRFLYAISGDAPDGTWPLDKTHGDRLLHRLPDPDVFPAWLTRADEDFYVAEFERSGFRGPLNRYRNSQRDFDYLSRFAGRTIDQPSLFIGGTRDLVLKMFPGVDWQTVMRAQLTDLRGVHLLDGCGHWTQQERPDAVTDILVRWLKALPLAG
jgi:pimeloyl-ACP methyl ester carboxylesterase